MSLLLDALKKAADDKNKQAEPSAVEKDKSLDLNLDLDQDILKVDEDKNNFPKVNEAALSAKKKSKPAKRPIKKPNDDSSSEDTHKEDILEDKPLELEEYKHTDLNIAAGIDSGANSGNAAIGNSAEAIKLDADKTAQETSETIESSKVSEDKIIANEAQPESSRNNIANDKQKHKINKVKNEQALSALINRSNQHSRKEKLKKNISIAILSALILIGSILYFYIQIKMSNQDLYISQNNNSDIIRKQIIENIEPEKTEAGQIQALKTDPVTNQFTAKSTVSKEKNINHVTQPRVQSAAIKKTFAPYKSANSSISIVRTKKSDPVHVLLQDAYNAFHKDDYQKSKKLYLKALNRETKNRDALLGLAAIAIKEKHFEVARQKYQYLLKLNPRDSIALAGLSNIEERSNPQLNESQIKFMLKQQPDAAHLYFALGTLYTSQEKWPEAQSAYFSAWSAENKNADYAYNLAVSLDHLDKRKQALDFYKLSLKLLHASSSNFSTINTEERIRTLQESSK